MKKRHSFIRTTAMVAVILIACFGLLQMCSDALGEAIVGFDVRKILESPGGKYVAYAYVTNAGAATDFGVAVTVVPRGHRLRYANYANVFTGITPIISMRSGKDAQTLVVYHANLSPENILRQEDRIGDIKIEYVVDYDRDY